MPVTGTEGGTGAGHGAAGCGAEVLGNGGVGERVGATERAATLRDGVVRCDGRPWMGTRPETARISPSAKNRGEREE